MPEKTDLNGFSRRVETLRFRVLELFQKIEPPNQEQHQFMEESFLELSTAMEELRVADEELREQVDELNRTRLQVDQERSRYIDLFQFAPDGYFVTDPEGTILEANHAAAGLLNISAQHLIKRPISIFVPTEEQSNFRQKIMRALNEPGQLRFETQIQPRKSPQTILASLTVKPVSGGNGRVKALRWTMRDVSGEKEMERALRESEIRFRAAFRHAPLGILLVDHETRITQANLCMATLAGKTVQTLAGEALQDLIDPDDWPMVRDRIERVKNGSLETAKLDVRLMDQDEGQETWTRFSIAPIDTQADSNLALICHVEDITEAHRTNLELAELQRRLFESIETERTLLARELHDRPMQDLYGVSIRLKNLRQSIDWLPVEKDLDEVLSSIQEITSTLRGMCGELRPPALAPFGLQRAMLSYLEQMQAIQPEIRFQYHLDDDQQRIPERTRLMLFRIFQAAVMNAIRHANADRISVWFHMGREELELEIEDNGTGFEVPENWLDLVREGHFGLASAAERAESLGGSFALESIEGEGTTVRVAVPLDSM